MVWVPDSSSAGYLGPKNTPAPVTDDAWDDFLHDVIAGITGLDNTKVLPGWQEEPPVWPSPRTTDWMSFRVTNQEADWMPAVTHDGTGDGQDLFQRHETSTVLCVFYGPNAAKFAGYLRDGIYLWQNMAALRAANVGLVEVMGFVSAPEMFRQMWINRVDTNLILRREIRRNYPVLNLLSAAGTVTGNGPGTHTVTSEFDTL